MQRDLQEHTVFAGISFAAGGTVAGPSRGKVVAAGAGRAGVPLVSLLTGWL
jgi:hypothetical protein